MHKRFQNRKKFYDCESIRSQAMQTNKLTKLLYGLLKIYKIFTNFSQICIASVM